jgi:hypothetical protein
VTDFPQKYGEIKKTQLDKIAIFTGDIFKGQLISKCPFNVFKSSKKTEIFPGFLP